MEELISKSDHVQKQIEEQFLKVKDVQLELDKKLADLNSSIGQAISKFKTSSDQIHSDAKNMFDGERSQMDQAMSNIDNTLQALQEEYKNKIDNLIKSTDGKSKEILGIYSELETIRKIQKDAAAEFGNISDDHKKVIEEFKKHQTVVFL